MSAVLVSLLAEAFDDAASPLAPPSLPPLQPLSPPMPPYHPPGLPWYEPCDGSCFFISEYAEPDDSTQNSYIEFYNGRGREIDAAHYSILICHRACYGATLNPTTNIPNLALEVRLSEWSLPIAAGQTFTVVYCIMPGSNLCADYGLLQRSVCCEGRGEGGD